MQLDAMRSVEAHAGQYVVLGLVHQGRQLEHLLPELVGT